jgi:hypothetical protein
MLNMPPHKREQSASKVSDCAEDLQHYQETNARAAAKSAATRASTPATVAYATTVRTGVISLTLPMADQRK